MTWWLKYPRLTCGARVVVSVVPGDWPMVARCQRSRFHSGSHEWSEGIRRIEWERMG